MEKLVTYKCHRFPHETTCDLSMFPSLSSRSPFSLKDIFVLLQKNLKCRKKQFCFGASQHDTVCLIYFHFNILFQYFISISISVLCLLLNYSYIFFCFILCEIFALHFSTLTILNFSIFFKIQKCLCI